MQSKRSIYFFPLFLVLYEFAVNSSNDMYLPALPQIARELAIDENQMQRTISAWLAGSAVAQFFLGPLSDRSGRRLVLLGGGLFFLLATIGCGFSYSIAPLMLFRFIQGIGVCTVGVAGYATIHELYDDKKAIQLFAWMGCISATAPMIGPVLGGAVLTQFDWRVIFYFIFALAVIPLGILYFIMPESNTQPDPTALNPKRLLSVYLRIFKNPSFMLSAFSYGLLLGGMIAWITGAPFLLMNVHGVSVQDFGWTQIPIFLAFVLATFSVRWIIERIGSENLIWLGLSVSTFSGLILLFFSLFFPLSFWGLLIPLFFYSAGFGLAAASLNRKTLSASTEKVGASTAIFQLAALGTGAFGSFAVSFVYNDTALSITGVMAAMITLSWTLNYVRNTLAQPTPSLKPV